jgi:hypothetical protein
MGLLLSMLDPVAAAVAAVAAAAVVAAVAPGLLLERV